MFGFFAKQDINKGVSEYNATNNAVLLDVRTSDEYRSGHIPGSVNIDVSDVGRVTSVVSDKTTPLFCVLSQWVEKRDGGKYVEKNGLCQCEKHRRNHVLYGLN